MEQSEEKVEQVLSFVKWFIILLIIIVSVSFCLIFVVVNMSATSVEQKIKNTQKNLKTEDLYIWYSDFPLVRGFTRDNDSVYMIKLSLGFLKKDEKKIVNDIEYKKVILGDLFIQWFSSQTEKYLLNTKNRSQIRFILIDKINDILSYPIYDVRFSKYRIEHFAGG